MNPKSKRTTDEDQTGFVTIAEAQEALRCGRTRIYELEREGKLQLRKFGGRTLVTERSVKRVLKEIEDTPFTREQENRRDG